MSGGNLWRLYVFIHRFYQLRAFNLAVPIKQTMSNMGSKASALLRRYAVGGTNEQFK